ncbi:MAG: hypothetical protein ACM34E_08695 [Acidobacteriota bacterium]
MTNHRHATHPHLSSVFGVIGWKRIGRQLGSEVTTVLRAAESFRFAVIFRCCEHGTCYLSAKATRWFQHRIWQQLSKSATGGSSIFIIGHSVPLQDKENLAQAFRRVSQAPIISLSRSIGDVPVEGADLRIDSDPQSLLEAIAKLARSKMPVLRAEA